MHLWHSSAPTCFGGKVVSRSISLHMDSAMTGSPFVHSYWMQSASDSSVLAYCTAFLRDHIQVQFFWVLIHSIYILILQNIEHTPFAGVTQYSLVFNLVLLILFGTCFGCTWFGGISMSVLILDAKWSFFQVQYRYCHLVLIFYSTISQSFSSTVCINVWLVVVILYCFRLVVSVPCVLLQKHLKISKYEICYELNEY